ncbi:hypothetical protein [Streptomyces sp. BBFR109]|uniref:hypothetical protein n=1 Tax=Streptomyces sp. BBFR109 TaxID=3448172 RepID=UPI003F7733B1
MTTSPTPDPVTAIYDAIDSFQREHRTVGGLAHAQIRTLLAEHLDRVLTPVQAAVQQPPVDRAAPTDWIDGHPQLEAIAAAVWEKSGRSDSGMCVEDDPRNIAVAAWAAVLAVLPEPVGRAGLRDRMAEVLRPHASLGGAPLRYELPFFDGATPSLPRISGWRPLDEVAEDLAAVLPEPADRAAELASARATNQRLNLRAQRLESELAAYRRAVSQWEISERGTYIPHASLLAIGRASGRDILGGVRYLKHFERVEQAEAEVERLRTEIERLRAEWKAERRELNNMIRSSNTAAVEARADRAAVLREAATEAEAENAQCNAVGPCQQCSARTTVAIRLRRMADEAESATPHLNHAARARLERLARAFEVAGNEFIADQIRTALNGPAGSRMTDEAQQTEPVAHQSRRGDQFEAWLKAQRDACFGHASSWAAVDGLLDQYRLHADTGTPLGEHVCDGQVVGDCDCLEQPATGAQQDEAPAVRRTDSDPDRIVGYQSRGGRLLRCLAHHPGRAVIESGDFRPVTSEDLPNGGLCTYPLSLEERCGADVLIPQPAAGARQDEAQKPAAAAQHLGGNAEDCPTCQATGFDKLTYPWLCPGPDQPPAAEEHS